MKQLFNIGIAGFGVWARGVQSTDEFLQARKTGFANLQEHEFVNPKPSAIPPKERRRAGLMINLAVEVAHQACEHAGVDKSLVPSVFASAMGDTAITDYMCRKLARPEKLLSPTKFHNSVHNAPSGYWTISAENRAPSSFVGGFRESFGAGLLEAGSQAQAYGTPVLLVAYDIANSAPFHDIEPVTETMGVGLIITDAQTTSASNLAVASCAYGLAGSTEKTNRTPSEDALSTPENSALNTLASANPIGGALALLEMLAGLDDPDDAQGQTLRFSAAPEAYVELKF